MIEVIAAVGQMMGKCLKVRKGDGIRIGDDVLIEVNQGSPHLFIACPDGMRIELIRRENRFERPKPREPKKHGILPPAAMILIAALLLGGCGDPAARTSSETHVGDEAVSRRGLDSRVSASGSFFEGKSRREWAMIEAVPWVESVDPRDWEPMEEPGLQVRVFRGAVIEVDTSGEAPGGAVGRLWGGDMTERLPACHLCDIAHPMDAPHDPDSLFYLISFWIEHDRFPTWKDAISHCSFFTRVRWELELRRRGVWPVEEPHKVTPRAKRPSVGAHDGRSRRSTMGER